jgi:hypothetical protein
MSDQEVDSIAPDGLDLIKMDGYLTESNLSKALQQLLTFCNLQSVSIELITRGLREMCRSIILAQTAEIQRMRTMLCDW